MPPYTCPHCGNDKYKTLLKGSITRCCSKQVVRVNGQIYINEDDAPEWQLIQFFVSLKRETRPFYQIPFGSEIYRKNLRAVSVLLERCDGDLELAKLAINVSFCDSDHRWRSFPDCISLISNRFWPDVFSKAKEKQYRAAELLKRQRVFERDLEGYEFDAARLF